jgi:hypothetical protein
VRVSQSLGNHRVLELGERGEEAELQPVEGATTRRERAVDEGDADPVLGEEVEQVDEAAELSGEPVDPVHHHLVDVPVLGGEHELDEPVAPQRRTALSLVVEAIHEAPPGDAPLLDEGAAPLGLQLARGDRWVDARPRDRLPRVDGAANDGGR